MNNYEKLCDILKTNSNLTTESGELLKNKVQELARKMDISLLTTLLSNSFTQDMFFVDVDGVKVFDVNKFTYIVESQAFLPDSYTRFKQNIMLTDGKQSIKKFGDVVLEFPNKDCILEFDSTDPNENRDEVFLNEVLMKKEIDTLLDHKAFTNVIKHTSEGSIPTTDISTNDNLIIKGNNLLALHTLYPKYKGQIKLMYWDILYNTKDEQVPYNDSFKHSSWLTMMKNRLEIAQKLLSDDGVICLQCDDNEQAYLKVLCDEVFGRDNFINSIAVLSSTPSGIKTAHREKTIIKTKDYILVYGKQKNITIKPQYVPVQEFDSHFNKYFDKENNKILSLKDVVVEQGIYDKKVPISEYSFSNKLFYKFLFDHKNNIFQTGKSMPKEIQAITLLPENKDKPIEYKDNLGNSQFGLNGRRISFLSKSIHMVQTNNGMEEKVCKLLCDFWDDVPFNNTQNEGNVSLPAGKKPEFLISRIIDMFTNKGDIVLDAYLGSGTTAAVAHKIGRKYIGVEQLDSHYEMSLKRLDTVINGDQTGISKTVNWYGGGSFVSFELAKNSHNIVDKIINSETTENLIEFYDELKSSPFVLYTVDILKMEENKDKFLGLTLEEQKEFLISIIDKNTLYINYSDIENDNYSLSEEDKLFTHNFYKED